MYVYIRVCVHVNFCWCVCMNVCMYECVNECMKRQTFARKPEMHVHVHSSSACLHVRVCVSQCGYVCVQDTYMYVGMCVCRTHTCMCLSSKHVMKKLQRNECMRMPQYYSSTLNRYACVSAKHVSICDYWACLEKARLEMSMVQEQAS
jgi:hypothetical protein